MNVIAIVTQGHNCSNLPDFVTIIFLKVMQVCKPIRAGLIPDAISDGLNWCEQSEYLVKTTRITFDE